MEDLLTSDVFGTFRYLAPNSALIPCFKSAKNINNQNPVFLDDIVEADYYFWPKTTTLNREPDVLLLLTKKDKSQVAIVVEAKYLSGKSNVSKIDPTDELLGDQLYDQYCELQRNNLLSVIPWCYERSFLDESPSFNCKKWPDNVLKYLFYVTSHNAFPTIDIEQSIRDLPPDDQHNVCWLSWQQIYCTLKEHLPKLTQRYENLLVYDLLALLTRRRLKPFKGWTTLNLKTPIGKKSNNYFFFGP